MLLKQRKAGRPNDRPNRGPNTYKASRQASRNIAIVVKLRQEKMNARI
jgi:hypothetical protein